MSNFAFIRPVEITTINGHILSREILQNLNQGFIIGCNIEQIVDNTELKKYLEETKNEKEMLETKIKDFELYSESVRNLLVENYNLCSDYNSIKIDEVINFFDIENFIVIKNNFDEKYSDLLNNLKNGGDKKILGQELKEYKEKIAKLDKFIRSTKHKIEKIKGDLNKKTHFSYEDFKNLKDECSEILNMNNEYTELNKELNKINSKIKELTVSPWKEEIMLKILQIQQDVCICELDNFFFFEKKCGLKLGDKITIKKEDIAFVLFGDVKKYINQKFNIKYQIFDIPEYWNEKNYTQTVKDLVDKNTLVRVIVSSDETFNNGWSKQTMKIIARDGDVLYGYSLQWHWEDNNIYNYVKTNCIYKFSMKTILNLQYNCGQIDKKLGETLEELYNLHKCDEQQENTNIMTGYSEYQDEYLYDDDYDNNIING